MNARDMNTILSYSKEGGNSNRKIAICTPFYNYQGYSKYITSLFQTTWFLAKYTSLEFDYWEIAGDAYVWRARNHYAKLLLDSDFTELFFIDSDIEWNLEGFLSIILRDEPIVGAAYPCKNNWEFYSCLIDCDELGYPEVTPDGLIKAKRGIVPTGFMKINRGVFEKLAETFPNDYYNIKPTNSEKLVKTMNFFGHLFEEHVPYGEDTSFCVRCRRAGIPIYVDPDITLKHYGLKAWEGNYHEYLMRQPRHTEAGCATSEGKI